MYKPCAVGARESIFAKPHTKKHFPARIFRRKVRTHLPRSQSVGGYMRGKKKKRANGTAANYSDLRGLQFGVVACYSAVNHYIAAGSLFFEPINLGIPPHRSAAPASPPSLAPPGRCKTLAQAGSSAGRPAWVLARTLRRPLPGGDSAIPHRRSFVTSFLP